MLGKGRIHRCAWTIIGQTSSYSLHPRFGFKAVWLLWYYSQSTAFSFM